MKLSDEHFEQLTAYLDGELNEHERREVDALLARDPQAAALLESLRRVSTSVAALPREAAPTWLSAAVQERMARRSLLDDASDARQELPRLVIWTNRLAVAACLGLVCTAGWLGVRSSNVQTPAVAVHENIRGGRAIHDGLAKEAPPEALALNATRGETQPPGSAVNMGRQPEQPARPGDIHTMVAFRDAGELERRLNDSGVSNLDIRQADLSSISNQLVIETDDPEMHESIVRVVEDFARKNRIPDVNSKQLPEPVQARQSFYVVSQTQQERSAASAPDETWIGINAPMNVTHELLDCVNKVNSQKKSLMQVEFNGCQMEAPNQATQILAANTARQRLLDFKGNAMTAAATASEPPPALAAPPGASSEQTLHDVTVESESNRSKSEAARASAKTPAGGSKMPDPRRSNEEKKVESKYSLPTESDSRADHDNESVKRNVAVGAGGQKLPRRENASMDEATGDDKPAAPPPASPSSFVTAAPVTPPGDGCVTLSICVRNPSAQHQRSIGAATSTQASDTIRPSGATSMPQASMPAAGADRE